VVLAKNGDGGGDLSIFDQRRQVFYVRNKQRRRRGHVHGYGGEQGADQGPGRVIVSSMVRGDLVQEEEGELTGGPQHQNKNLKYFNFVQTLFKPKPTF
jgi:hypothetical protein